MNHEKARSTRGISTAMTEPQTEIVKLAEKVGTKAPVNAAIVQLIKDAETKGSPGLSAVDLRGRLGL